MFQSGKHRRCNFDKTCQGSLKMFPNVIFQKWKTNVLKHFFHKGRWGGQRAYLPLWHSEFETCWCFFVPQSFEKNEKIKRGRQYHVKISLAFLHAKEVPTQPQKRLQPSLNKVALQSQWCKLLNPVLICTSVSLVGGKFNFLTVASRKSMTKRFWSSTFSNRF